MVNNADMVILGSDHNTYETSSLNNDANGGGLTQMILVTQSPIRSTINSKLDKPGTTYHQRRNELNNSINGSFKNHPQYDY